MSVASFVPLQNSDRKTTTDEASAPPIFYPEMGSDDDLRTIRDIFFVHDCVLIRRLLNPARLKFFRALCDTIYVEDDRRMQAGQLPPDLVREYQNGWIWEPRLRKETGGVFGYEDIVLNKKLFAFLNLILSDAWYTAAASQIRRMPPRAEDYQWGSQTSYHLDAQWGDDRHYHLNVWVPFTPCGVSAAGLEFLLTPADTIRRYGRYDPGIPSEPKTWNGASPRMDYGLFALDILQQQFHPQRFWAPRFEVGDVVIFSNWCAHRTALLPAMTDMRISLEWRVFVNSFDTPLRPQQTGDERPI